MDKVSILHKAKSALFEKLAFVFSQKMHNLVPQNNEYIMYEELREKAVEKIEKDKERRNGILLIGYVFAGVALVLFIISMKIGGPAAFWIRFPMIILALVYGVLYFGEFGFPFTKDSKELTDEEIEREMVNIYRRSNLHKITNSEVDKLELREIENLKNRLDEGEEFV